MEGYEFTMKRTAKTGLPLRGDFLAETIDCCNRCDLGSRCNTTRCIDARNKFFQVKQVYVFVDEYPSDVEHVLNEPLVGAIADPLKTILTSFLPPEKIYVAYVNYCASYEDKILEIDRKACLPNLQLILSTLEPLGVFALGSKVSKFLTKNGITHTELPAKFNVYVNELDRQRLRLTLKQFFNER